jgi:hypothetical protein
MPKGSLAFKETEVSRAIRGVRKGGENVRKIKITKQGEIEIETGPPTAPAGNDDDEWKVA